MTEQRYLPDADRISVLTAMVMLAYALTRLILAPQFTLELQLPGLYFAYPFNLNMLISLLAAGLTATGMDWLLRSHPSLRGKRTVEHWFLPTLTSFVIGVPLSLLPSGPVWWIGFGIGGILLVLVFLAEYVVVEPADLLYPLATAGLTALSYALYLILAVALRYGGTRLMLVIPALFPAAILVSLRTLHLRLGGRWEFAWSAGIALVCIQLAAGLHYWPLTPMKSGLILVGPLYALTDLAAGLREGAPLRRAAIAPAVILALAWVGSIWVH
jgi:hypothetical protein